MTSAGAFAMEFALANIASDRTGAEGRGMRRQIGRARQGSTSSRDIDELGMKKESLEGGTRARVRGARARAKRERNDASDEATTGRAKRW